MVLRPPQPYDAHVYEPLLRFLAYVRRELGAYDARAEIGGRPPEGDCTLARDLDRGMRLVVVFDEPPADRPVLEARLREMVAAFRGVSASSEMDAVRPPPVARAAMIKHDLGEALFGLARRIDAEQVLVIDARSPLIFGASHSYDTRDVDEMLLHARTAEVASAQGLNLAELLDSDEPPTERALLTHVDDDTVRSSLARQLLHFWQSTRHMNPDERAAAIRVGRAVRLTREAAGGEEPGTHSEHGLGGPRRFIAQADGFACFARGFASIYWLIAVFPKPFSELHVEARTIHALPHVERLVVSLPPTDPTEGAGRGAVRRLRPVK